MERLRIVADSDIPFLKGILEPYASVKYVGGIDISSADMADADVLIVRTRTRCTEALLKGSRAGMICTATAGLDHIDTGYCRDRGIEVFAASGSNSRGVLQWVAAALAYINPVPQETTVGIVGVGNVGGLVERYLRQWGFRLLRCDLPRARREGGDFVTLEELAAHSDIVTLHTPLNMTGEDRTFHLVDRRILRLLRRGAYILNSSRGEVVDTAALTEAIAVRGCMAIVDTWENEPQIDRLLLREAVLATPHIAGYSLQGRANAIAMIVRHLSERFGWPLRGWYPPQAGGVALNCAISWHEMRASMGSYFDIAAQSDVLKREPARFEQLRSSYMYRMEFF